MRRTDGQVEADVREELFWDGRLDAQEIAVAVRGGVVTLRGTVGSFPQKWAATEAAKRVTGVVGVENELEVRLLDMHLRADAELRGEVLQALAWNVLVPPSVDARISGGVVTLRGSVHDRFQREEAELTVRNLHGVRDVLNEIAIEREPTAVDVEQAIERALVRAARIDADGLRIESVDGKVTLSGSVRSWSEHDAAVDAAWSAPGVTAVEDRLVVAYER